eukprot:3053126-Ditylum_brightwellii.AAC.1
MAMHHHCNSDAFVSWIDTDWLSSSIVERSECGILTPFVPILITGLSMKKDPAPGSHLRKVQIGQGFALLFCRTKGSPLPDSNQRLS